MLKAFKVIRLGLGGAIFGYALFSALGPMFSAPELGMYGWAIGFAAATAGAAKVAAVI